MSTLIAFDIDGTLIDTGPSFSRIIQELSSATDEEIQLFRDNGGFNDDWELTRAAMAWIAAGRPRILDRCSDWRDVVAWCGHDPGDLSGRCIELYRGGYWRDERLLIKPGSLQRVAGLTRVAVCTGRDRWEMERAEELLGFSFPHRTTAEDVKKPAPEALLRLVQPGDDVVVLLGDTEADRRTVVAARAQHSARAEHSARFFFIPITPAKTAQAFIDAVLEAHDVHDVHEVASRFGEA